MWLTLNIIILKAVLLQGFKKNDTTFWERQNCGTDTLKKSETNLWRLREGLLIEGTRCLFFKYHKSKSKKKP